MSKVAIKGASTGTATFTIESPATNTNRTLTLPDAAGTVSVADSNGIISANGIAFPATQSASADANTLDDYEEGTWTPAQGTGLTVNGAFTSSGTYTKIGRLVYVKGTLSGATNISCAQNGQLCTGLPFVPIAGENIGISIDQGRLALTGCSALGSSAVQSVEGIASTTFGIAFSVVYTTT